VFGIHSHLHRLQTFMEPALDSYVFKLHKLFLWAYEHLSLFPSIITLLTLARFY